ncbi:alpha-L-fucosidase [Colletotrichum caudatum]|nr:alpha-L-fucosidase [Colletotrichum caudatum]
MTVRLGTMRASLTAAASFLLASVAIAQLEGPYEATWQSTDKHHASPEWFRDAKFGVYWHWGAFTTPEYGSEWYGRNVYAPDSSERAEHTRRYGPPEVWGYQNFILGANDLQGNHVEFKPVLASDGGAFDPDAWMAVVNASGARFAGPVAEHHDGFSMWDSKVNTWNSVRHGPRFDLVKLWADLVRQSGMKFLIAMHQAFNTNGFYEFAPQMNDTELQLLFGQLPKDQADQRWLDKQLEVLDHVQPDMIWNDFSLDSPGYCQNPKFVCNIGEAQRLAFLSHYFNRGVEWGKEVLTTYKHFDSGFRNTSAVADFERGGPDDIVRPYWLTDDAISASSWSYTVGIAYYSSTQMIHSLLDRVSKNGNMLLNISPTAAGVLPDQQVKVLLDIGAYLGRYGESIYGTRAWDIYGEGPNKAGGGSFSSPLTGNSSDIRFTRNKAKDVLYVTVLGWPADATVSIASLGSGAGVDLAGLIKLELLGNSAGEYAAAESWTQESGALVVKLPAKPEDSFAYVLKLSFADHIPVPLINNGASVFTGNDTKALGISLPRGEFSSVFFEDAGVHPNDIQTVQVSAGTSVEVYASANLTGDFTTLGAGEHAISLESFGSIVVKSA